MRLRKVRWQREFWKALDEQAKKPFVWGERDCILFGSTIADSILVEPCMVQMAKSAFTWSSAREAAHILRHLGMRDAVETMLGPGVPWTRLGMGDLVLCRYEDPGEIFDACLGIHDGTNPVLAGDRTLVVENWHNVICGWKV